MERRFILFFRLRFSICSAVARHRFLSFQEAQRKKAVSSHRTPQKKNRNKRKRSYIAALQLKTKNKTDRSLLRPWRAVLFVKLQAIAVKAGPHAVRLGF